MFNLHKKERGFTIMDILISTAIVSLLSSVFLFRVTEAKKKAEDSQMKVESQQVSNAVALYKQDHDGRAPLTTSSNTEGTVGVMHSEGDPDSDFLPTMQTLVSQGYLAEIPRSPSGSSYVYGVTEDGQVVFGAKLNNSSSSNLKNSCQAVVDSQVVSNNNSCPDNPTVPFPSPVNFAVQRFPLPAAGGPTGTCTTGSLSSYVATMLSWPYTCIDNNTSNQNSLCSCSNGIATSNNISVTPTEICTAMFDSSCQPYPSSQIYSYYKAFAFNNSDYQNYLIYLGQLQAYQQSVEELEQCEQEQQEQGGGSPLCDGSSDSDYCQCI